MAGTQRGSPCTLHHHPTPASNHPTCVEREAQRISLNSTRVMWAAKLKARVGERSCIHHISSSVHSRRGSSADTLPRGVSRSFGMGADAPVGCRGWCLTARHHVWVPCSSLRPSSYKQHTCSAPRDVTPIASRPGGHVEGVRTTRRWTTCTGPPPAPPAASATFSGGFLDTLVKACCSASLHAGRHSGASSSVCGWVTMEVRGCNGLQREDVLELRTR